MSLGCLAMQLYLTPIAIGYLAQFFLAALISGYFVLLLRQSPRTIHLVWLAGFFIALTGFIATLFLEAAFLLTVRLYAVFLQNTLLGFALTCLLQFTYHFPVRATARRWEASLVLILSGLYTLWEAGYALWRFIELRLGHILYRPPWSDYALLLLLLWAPLNLCRQTCALSSGERGWRRYVRPLWQPTTREGRAARSFTLIFLLAASLSLFNILRATYLLSVALANLAISLGILIALFSFAAVYLNYRPETTSFIVKLVGMTLAVVLAIMGGVGWVISPIYEEQYQPDLSDQHSLRFSPNESGGYDITAIPFAFAPTQGRKLDLAEDAARTCGPALDYTFPFYGRVYSQVYACNDGAISLGQRMTYRMYQYNYGAGAPLILPLLTDLYPEISPGGVFVQQQDDRLIVTWQRLRGFKQQEIEFTFQAILYPDGRFDFNYNGLPAQLAYHPNDDPGASVWAVGALPGGLERPVAPQIVSLSALPLSAGPEGVLQDYHLEFRQHLHDLFAPLAGLIIIASLLIVVGFPLLFRTMLVAPLNALIRGVRRAQTGNYEPVPVHHSDEIGFLTRAFNALTNDLDGAISALEARVAARTAELDATNVQLRIEITEREQAQANLIEQQRTLAALEERERLARDLHDGLGQVMGYINVQAQAAQTFLDKAQVPAAQSNLVSLAQAAQKAHGDIRAHILSLRHPEQLRHDFLPTVRDYLQGWGQEHGLETSLSAPDDLPATMFTPAVEEQALRILQEGLANVRKHAGAHQVQVVLRFVGDYAQMMVMDDGGGFDTSQHPGETTQQFGLSIMQERAESVGGTLEIDSRPGQGTHLVATLPLFLPSRAADDQELVRGLRVLLADDHPLFLDGLRNLLVARGITVVGVARDGHEAQEKTRALQPDVVVMDLNMPGCDGLEATRAIKAEFPEVKVVILTVSEDEATLFQAIKNGASGYLLKSLEANQFCRLLVDLMQGEVPLAPGMTVRVLDEFASMASRPTLPSAEEAQSLSPQQWDILSMVAQGMTYKEIAVQLHLSEQTIKYHMGRIIDLLQLENRTQAIIYYQQKQQE